MSIVHMYEIHEKDIANVVRFLELTDPEHATPQMAIAILEYLQAKIHMLAHTDPQKLEAILKDLQKDSQAYQALLQKVQTKAD